MDTQVPSTVVEQVEQPTDPLDALTARHEAILLSLVSGRTAREVAGEFDISESRLSILRSSPLWRESEARVRKQLREDAILQIESLRGSAISALRDTVEVNGPLGMPNAPEHRIQSARQILDRAGLPSSGPVVGTIQAPTINLYIPPSWRQLADTQDTNEPNA